MNDWKQPVTTRRYLHPPKSERLVTMWIEGEIILGEMVFYPDGDFPDGTFPDYSEQISCGLFPVYGKDGVAADFKTAHTLRSDNGIPVYRIENKFGDLNVTIEAFCDTHRKSTCYAEFYLQNESQQSETFGLLLRTGFEEKMIHGAPDLYNSYKTKDWKDIPATWIESDGIYRDGGYFLKSLSGEWQFDRDAGKLWITVEPGEQMRLRIMLGKDRIPETDYEAQKANTISFYKKELKRIANLPKRMDRELTENLVIQLLQFFTSPVESDLVMCRQGSLRRWIWPFEAKYALEALDVLGDFDDYIDPVIDLYFNTMQLSSGEIVPLGIYWAMSTANCLYSFADHAIRKGKAYYDTYRDKALAGFYFIKNTRVKESSDPGIITGLFPPKRASDAENVFQAWLQTDCENLIGLKRLAEAAKLFDDPKAGEILSEYTDYRFVIESCFNRAKEMAKDPDKINVTSYVPGTKAEQPDYVFRASACRLGSVLDLPLEDVERLLNALKDSKSVCNGLYNRMPANPTSYNDPNQDGVVRFWYTTATEYFWFDALWRLGKKEKCIEIVEAFKRYSMTGEYQMVERFHERDPYYGPWSPNASANGRLLLLLYRIHSEEMKQ